MIKNLLLIFLIPGVCFSQFTTFQRTFDHNQFDFGLAVQQTADGGYMLFGESGQNNPFSNKMLLVKTDAFGNVLWSNEHGNGESFGISARQTFDGGYILCGSDGNIGDDTLTLIKTDNNGFEIWNHKYSAFSNRDVGECVRQTSDSGFVAVGFTGPNFNESIYVVKTDFNGNLQWSTIVPNSGSGRESGFAIEEFNNNGYIICGQTGSKGNGGDDIYLVRLNSLGDTLWTRTFGTINDEVGKSIDITNDGGIVLLGHEYFPGGNILMIKTDSLGNQQWLKSYGGSGWDLSGDVKQIANGGFIIAGRKEDPLGVNQMYCIKTDTGGNVIWDHTYPNGFMSDANSVWETTDGGFILLGSKIDTTGSQTSDYYYVKIDSGGVVSVQYQNILKDEKVKCFPNPFSYETKFYFDKNIDLKNSEILIYNSIGDQMRRIDLKNLSVIPFKRDDLSAGFYYFKLLCKNSVISSGKLIIQ